MLKAPALFRGLLDLFGNHVIRLPYESMPIAFPRIFQGLPAPERGSKGLSGAESPFESIHRRHQERPGEDLRC
ncbi:MAG: hypothetical protein DRH20_05650 [Deltaproteobacteria bacterium]|nr:MAG: hypothetical protein DRH20_05650 [Deltaproteobacteria bacterium]